MQKNFKWIGATFVLVPVMGFGFYLISPIKSQFTPPAPAATIDMNQFIGAHYYELNMDHELPMTTECLPITAVEVEKFASYRCLESDDQYLSDWSCGKPTDDETPSREFIEIIRADLVTCKKKLEDFRERFQ